MLAQKRMEAEKNPFYKREDAELCLELARSLEAAYTGFKNPGEAVGSWGDEFLFLLEQLQERDRPPLEQVYMVTSKILLTQARYGQAPLARRVLQNPQAFLGSILEMMCCAPIDF
jgi:hypothetical protein